MKKNNNEYTPVLVRLINFIQE